MPETMGTSHSDCSEHHVDSAIRFCLCRWSLTTSNTAAVVSVCLGSWTWGKTSLGSCFQTGDHCSIVLSLGSLFSNVCLFISWTLWWMGSFPQGTVLLSQCRVGIFLNAAHLFNTTASSSWSFSHYLHTFRIFLLHLLLLTTDLDNSREH